MLKNEKQLIALLAAIQFTNIVDFMIMMPMGDILMEKLEINPSKFGLLVSSYGFAAFVTAVLGVFYLDKLDRKKALLNAYFGFMIATISSAVVPNTQNPELNYWLFIGTRIVTGLTGGLLGGLVLSIIGDVIPIERRGKAMGMITIAFSLASIAGVPLALWLVDLTKNNWHVPFYFVSLLCVPAWLLGFKFIPEMKSHLRPGHEATSRTESIQAIFGSSEMRNALLFTLLLVLGQFTIISMLTPYLINNVGLEQYQIKFTYLVGGGATVLSGVLIGILVDKIGRFRVFTIFALLSVIPIWLNTHMGITPLWIVLLIGAMFFVFVTGRMIAANTISSAVVSPQHRAGFMSLNSACMSLGVGISSVIAGAIVTKSSANSPLTGYDRVGYLAIASTILSLLVVRKLKRISVSKSDQTKV